MTKHHRMAAGRQSQFQEAMREAEMAELKQHFDTIQDAAKGIGSFDPAGSIANPRESAAAEKPPEAPPPGSAATAPVPEPTPAEPPAPTQSAAAGLEAAPPAPASAGEPAVAPGPGRPEAGKGQPG